MQQRKKNCDKIVLHTHLLVPFHSSSEECVVRSVLYKSNFVVSVFICVMCVCVKSSHQSGQMICFDAKKMLKIIIILKNNNNNNNTKF